MTKLSGFSGQDDSLNIAKDGKTGETGSLDLNHRNSGDR